MLQAFEFDVFLSHNTADKPRVRLIAERMRQAGVRVWFDEWIIEYGDDIYLAIERGLECSRTLILCMSNAAFGSEWVRLERSTSLFRDPMNRDRRFVPLLLEDCTIPATLRRYRYVDYRQEDDPAFQSLLAACRSSAPQPPPEARAPGQKTAAFDAGPPQAVPIAEAAKAAASVGRADNPRIANQDSPDPWVTIPAGDFRMGSQKSNSKKPNYDAETFNFESPVHEVYLSAYRIGRHEVTVAEYKWFVDAGGYSKETHWKAGSFGRWQQPDSWKEQLANPNRPVTGVSWYEASAYAAWAGCRLPTEAEWERAARGTDARKYPWVGDEAPDQTRANFDGKIGHPTPVGNYPLGATPEGIQDMAGNVWEWCQDVWHDDYKAHRSMGPRGQQAATQTAVFFAAARGATTPGTAAAPFATGAGPTSATPASGFVLRRGLNPLLSYPFTLYGGSRGLAPWSRKNDPKAL